jgi:hypothetical protein
MKKPNSSAYLLYHLIPIFLYRRPENHTDYFLFSQNVRGVEKLFISSLNTLTLRRVLLYCLVFHLQLLPTKNCAHWAKTE